MSTEPKMTFRAAVPHRDGRPEISDYEIENCRVVCEVWQSKSGSRDPNADDCEWMDFARITDREDLQFAWLACEGKHPTFRGKYRLRIRRFPVEYYGPIDPAR